MAYFDKYGVEFSDDRKTLICCPKDFQGEYVIPEGVEFIGNSAFLKCRNLTSVIIPNTIKFIGESAFEECNYLRYVHIEESQVHINECAYDETGNFIPHYSHIGLISIGSSAFRGCSRLIDINLPYSLINIGSHAFYCCSSLKSIVIPQNVSRIEDEAFAICNNLEEVFFLNKNYAIQWGKSVFMSNKIGPTNKIMLAPSDQFERLTASNNRLSPYITIKGSVEADIRYVKQIIQTYLGKNDNPLLVFYVQGKGMDDYAEYQKIVVDVWLRRIKEGLLTNYIGTDKNIIYYSDEKSLRIDGYEIPNEIYLIFRDMHIDLPEEVWCSSGKDVFERMQDQNGLHIGCFTPRYGYYKVQDIVHEPDGDYLMCYYSVRDSSYFIDESVKIKMRPLYNKFSTGPKDEEIMIGDVFRIERPVELVESSYEKTPYQTYRIIWEFLHHTTQHRSYTRDIEDMRYYEAEARFIEENSGVDILDSIA